MTALDEPRTLPLKTEPWQHQIEAFEFACEKTGVLLAIGMGGGKSAVAIALAEHHAASRVLILCPKSVVGVWPREFDAHAVRKWATWAGVVNGPRGRLRNPSVARRAEALVHANRDALVLQQPFVAVVNFEAAIAGDMAKLLLGTPWDLVIVDESHRIKAPDGKQSKFVAQVCSRARRSETGRVVLLTGTPMPHSPLDLWAQMRALDGGLRLGTSYHRFCQHYGAGENVYTAGGVQRMIYKNLREDRRDEFDEHLAPILFQVQQDDLDRALGLEPPVDVDRAIELDSATRRIYDELERDLIAELPDGIGVVTAANRMVLTTRLAQLSGGFAREPDGRLVQISETPEKARLLADTLEDLPPREPIVVFARFHADLDAIANIVEKAGRRYGELSGRRRDGLTDEARMNPNIDVLGCQLQSGGVGIDLTRARYAIYYSLDFTLGDYDQSRKRVHRPGQQRRVTYIHLLAENTIDRAIYGALRKRRSVIAAVLDRLKQKGATP